jgi:hypothetical protein
LVFFHHFTTTTAPSLDHHHGGKPFGSGPSPASSSSCLSKIDKVNQKPGVDARAFDEKPDSHGVSANEHRRRRRRRKLHPLQQLSKFT